MARDRLVRDIHVSDREMHAVAFSPDGTLLAMGGGDRAVYVVTIEGRVVYKTTPHPGEVWGVDWSPDGHRLVSVSNNGCLCIWNARNGELDLRVEIDNPYPRCPRWSPDGHRIVVGCFASSHPVVLDAGTGRIEYRLVAHTACGRGVAWSPNGLYIASALEDQSVRIWDASTGLAVRRIDADTRLYCVAWSPDEGKLTAGGDAGTMLVWDASTGARLLEVHATRGETIWTVAWSPDSRFVASGDDRNMELWDAQTAQNLAVVSTEYGVAFSSDGTLCATTFDHGARLYRVADLVVRAPLPAPLRPGVAYAGRQAATVGRRPTTTSTNAPLWVPHLPDAEGRCLGVLTTSSHRDVCIIRVAVFPNNRSAITGHKDGYLRRWDLTSGKLLWEARDTESAISAIAIAPDETYVAVGNEDGAVLIFGAEGSHCLQRCLGHSRAVTQVSWSPDAHCVASLEGRAKEAFRVWNADTGALLLTGGDHAKRPQALRWSPDGRWLASGDDSGTTFLWDVTTGACLARCTPFGMGGHVIWDLCWSPDSVHVVVSTMGGELCVLRAADGEVVSRWQHESEISALDWSADGRFVASGSRGADRSICVSDPLTGKQIERFPVQEDCYWCAWSRDGAFLASSAFLAGKSCVATVRLWDTRHLFAAAEVAAPLPSTLPPRSLAILPSTLGILLRHGKAAPLSLLHDLLALTGGHPLSSDAAGLAHHRGTRALAQLGWPTPSRVALVLWLLRNYHDPAFALPAGTTPAEIETRLTAALAGPAIAEDRPATPMSALAQALDAVDDRLLTLLSALGAQACAADPSLPLTLAPRLADIAPLTAPERRVLALQLGANEGRAHTSGVGHERAGLSPLGDLRSLLPSQWALPEPLRAYRHRQGGLLYRARVGREPPRLRPTVLVLDVSPPCFGPIERILRPAAHALASALLAASEPAYCIAAGGDNRVRPLQHRLDLVELCTARTLEPINAERTLAQARMLAASLSGQGALDPIIVLFTQPWFGAEDRHVAVPPHLRALFVHYPGRPIEPAWHDRCERWEVVSPGAVGAVSGALGRLMV